MSFDFEGTDFSSLTWILVPTSTVDIKVMSNSSRDIDVRSVVIGRRPSGQYNFRYYWGAAKNPQPLQAGGRLAFTWQPWQGYW
jgi:hypothetical protein